MRSLFRKNWNFLMSADENGKLAHAFLFCGPENCGKFDFAIEAAKVIGGFKKEVEKLRKGEDPDLFIVQPEIEIKKKISREKNISTDQIKHIMEKSRFFPYQAKQKFLIVKKAEMMTNSAANSILKLIEEPVSDLKVILCAENEQAVLPTIKSRCQILRFGLVREKKLKEHLTRIYEKSHPGKKVPEKTISKICSLSGGRAKLAEKLLADKQMAEKLDENLANFRAALRGGVFAGLKFSEKESTDKQRLIFSLDRWILYLGDFIKKTIKDGSDRKIQKKVLFMLKELLELKKQLKNTNASERLLLDNYFVKINWQ